MSISPAKAKQAEEPHDIYVVRDEHDRVIYVGLSWHAVGRIYSHRLNSPWGRVWARIELRSFPTRHEAEQFERSLIDLHSPIFNRQNHGGVITFAARDVEMLNVMMDNYVLWRRATYGPDASQPRWPDRPPTLAEIKHLHQFNEMRARHAFASAR